MLFLFPVTINLLLDSVYTTGHVYGTAMYTDVYVYWTSTRTAVYMLVSTTVHTALVHGHVHVTIYMIMYTARTHL